MEHVTVGQKVWHKDTYGNVCTGVAESMETVHAPGTGDVAYVSVRGKYGAVTVLQAGCYPSRRALLDVMEKAHADKVKGYCEGIKTVEDLVAFMYGNNVACAEEYTDWAAREAARKMAFALLGLEMEG